MPNHKPKQHEFREKNPMGKKETRSARQDNRQNDDAEESTKNRRVYLFGRLENEIALPVIKRLLKLNDRNAHKPIDLIINSAGGNGYNADAIIATMCQISAPVNTICTGHALSGACEVLASGTGKRIAYEYATIMFHQTLWEADGDITNLEIQAKQGQRFRDAQIHLLSRCTGQDEKTIRRDIERDFYLSSKEALAYGLIDEVVPLGRRGGTATHSNGKVTPKAVAARSKSEGTRKTAAARK
jgi:ATP-dependent Clp protease protease subunit